MNRRQFAREYFGHEKSLEIISRETRIPVSTLYSWATKKWGLTLRNPEEARRVGYIKGRGPYYRRPYEVDWKEFETLYYGDEMSLKSIAPRFGYAHSNGMSRRAGREGYKMRSTGPAKKR